MNTPLIGHFDVGDNPFAYHFQYFDSLAILICDDEAPASLPNSKNNTAMTRRIPVVCDKWRFIEMNMLNCNFWYSNRNHNRNSAYCISWCDIAMTKQSPALIWEALVAQRTIHWWCHFPAPSTPLNKWYRATVWAQARLSMRFYIVAFQLYLLTAILLWAP